MLGLKLIRVGKRGPTGLHFSVASAREVYQSLAKLPLTFIGSLTNLGLTSLVTYTTGVILFEH